MRHNTDKWKHHSKGKTKFTGDHKKKHKSAHTSYHGGDKSPSLVLRSDTKLREDKELNDIIGKHKVDGILDDAFN